MVELKLSVELVHGRLWVDLEHGSRRQLLGKGAQGQKWQAGRSGRSSPFEDPLHLLAEMHKPWLLLLVLLQGSHVALALWGAGFRNLVWQTWGQGWLGVRQEMTTPLCRAAPLTRPCCRDGIGSAGCGKQTWCSDCPVSPCGMGPVCLSHSRGTGNMISANLPWGLERLQTATGRISKLVPALRLLRRVEKTSHLCPCCCEQFWAAFTDVDVR